MPRTLPFAEIQERYGDIPGDRGIELRRKHYRPHFMKFGRDVCIEERCRFYHPSRIVLEDGVRINNEALIYGSGGVRIGRHTLIGPRCFIHSANHDIALDTKPFNERGYDEAPVDIGEHNLISANVSILPGTRTGAHSFMACGAVITGKEFKPHARLKGVPAEAEYPALPAAPKATPSIAVYTHKEADWNALGEHLMSVLRLPQAGVYREGDVLPDSVHSAILFGPSNWEHKINVKHVWKLTEGETELDQRGFPTKCPAHVVSLDTKLSEAIFWLDTRLSKGAGKLNVQEYDEWLTTLAILELKKDRDDKLLQRWKKYLARRKPFSRMLGSPSIPLVPKSIMMQPELLVRALVKKTITDEKAQTLLSKCLESPANGKRLVAYVTAAYLLGERQLAARLEATLGENTFPFASENSKTLCYSPLVLAWRFLSSGQKDIPEYCGQVRDRSLQLAWRGFNQSFYDTESKRISRDLVDNWRSLHHLPLADREHYLLKDDSYKVDSFAIEQFWLALFKHIQHQAGEPLMLIKPWPAGYDSALSLRYDVDRPINSDTLTQIVEMQSAFVNAPCGSWYYFVKHPHRERQMIYAHRHAQEFAIHAESDSDAEAGVGFTHHSAPFSRYWGGVVTCKALADTKALYGEWLTMNCRVPRAALGYPSVSLTPLHFPLEGSTKDTTLRYFRRLLPQLHNVLLSGGHVIIGTHPDLNQDLMKRALSNILSPNLWCATVKDVVSRVRQLEQIRIVKSDDGIALYSPESISDLVIENWNPDGTKTQATTQLLGGVARTLEAKI